MIIQLRIWCGWPITNRTRWALFGVWSGRGDIVQCTYTWPPAAWRWLLGWLVGRLVGWWVGACCRSCWNSLTDPSRCLPTARLGEVRPTERKRLLLPRWLRAVAPGNAAAAGPPMGFSHSMHSLHTLYYASEIAGRGRACARCCPCCGATDEVDIVGKKLRDGNRSMQLQHKGWKHLLWLRQLTGHGPQNCMCCVTMTSLKLGEAWKKKELCQGMLLCCVFFCHIARLFCFFRHSLKFVSGLKRFQFALCRAFLQGTLFRSLSAAYQLSWFRYR